MFRANTLTPLHPSANHNRQAKRSHHNYKSLRTLIADKTVRYQHQFERIALDQNQLVYSSHKKKPKNKTECQCTSPGMIRIRQFQLPVEKQNNASPTSRKHAKEIQVRSNFQPEISPLQKLEDSHDISSYQSIKEQIMTPKLSEKSESQSGSSREQPEETIRILKDQLERNSKQLEIKEQRIKQCMEEINEIKLQKSNLEQTVEKLTLDNQALKVSNQQKVEQISRAIHLESQKIRKLKVTPLIHVEIKNERLCEEVGLCTDLHSDEIGILYAEKSALEAKAYRLQKQATTVEEFLTGKIYISEQNAAKQSNLLCQRLQTYHESNKKAHQDQVQLFKEVNKQIKKNYEEKIENLVKLLNRAQSEIKVLLGKLRQASQHSVNEYRKSMYQHRQMARNSEHKEPSQQ